MSHNPHTNSTPKNEIPTRESKADNKVNWRNEHGQPSFEYLTSLAAEESIRSQEKLRSIAEDLDVDYDPLESTDVLIREIIAASQSDPHSTT